MREFRRFALIAIVLTASWLSADSVPDPTKRPGASPLFRISRDYKWGYMNPKGKVLIRPQFDYERDFFHGLAGVLVDKKWGFVDVHGAIAIRPQFDDVRDFLDDLAPVRIGRKWGYIDTGGRMAIRPQFQAAAEFHEGLARVHIFDKVSCSSGQYTSETAPERTFRLHDDMAERSDCFPVGGRFGFIDKAGTLVIAPRFFQAQDFSEGLAAVWVEQSSSKSGYIDRTGAFVIEPVFNQAEPFSEGLAAVETSAHIVGNHVVDIAWGFIDKTGKLAIPAKYQFAGKFSGGLARVDVRSGESVGYVDRKGKMVIAPSFIEAWDFSEGLAVACIDECAYIDRSGVPVIKLRGIWWPFSGGLAVLGLRDDQVYIDKGGRTVAPYSTDK